MLATGFALFIFVGCLSVVKFRRVKRERLEFEKIKAVVKEIPAEEAKLRLGALNVEDDFIKGRQGGKPLS